MPGSLKKAMDRLVEEREREEKEKEQHWEEFREHLGKETDALTKAREARNRGDKAAADKYEEEAKREKKLRDDAGDAWANTREQIKGKTAARLIMSAALFPENATGKLGKAKKNLEQDKKREQQDSDKALKKSKEHRRKAEKLRGEAEKHPIGSQERSDLEYQAGLEDAYANIEAERAHDIDEQIKGKKTAMGIIEKEMGQGTSKNQKHGMYYLGKSKESLLAEKAGLTKEKEAHLGKSLKAAEQSSELAEKAAEAESAGDKAAGKLKAQAEEEEEKAAIEKDLSEALAGQIEGLDISLVIIDEEIAAGEAEGVPTGFFSSIVSFLTPRFCAGLIARMLAALLRFYESIYRQKSE